MNDSTAWLRTSSPLDAATAAACVRVFSGSTMPSVGLSRRLAMPVLACSPRQIEDADAGRLAPGAGGGRYRDQRLQRPGHRHALADRRIDVVEEIGGRVGRIEVRGLGGVDRGAAADGHEPIGVDPPGEGDRLEEGLVGRFDAHSIEDIEGDAGGFERGQDGLHRGQPRDRGIGDDERPPDAERLEIGADLTGDAGAEAHGRRRHLECVFVFHGGEYSQDLSTPRER